GKDALASVAQFDVALASATTTRPTTLADAWIEVENLSRRAADVVAHITNAAKGDDNAGVCAQTLARQCTALRDELIFFAPWLELPSVPRTNPDLPGPHAIPTLRQLATVAAAWTPTSILGRDDGTSTEARDLLSTFQRFVTRGGERAKAMIADIDQLALRTSTLAEMDF